MAELDAITEMLRRQRRDLDDQRDDTLSRSEHTAEILARIEELRARSEKTSRIFQSQPDESRSRKK
jgi:hypothetical protein